MKTILQNPYITYAIVSLLALNLTACDNKLSEQAAVNNTTTTPEVQASLKAQSAKKMPARTIIGYAAPLSVRPGDKVDFMANAIGGGAYEADLVRIVNGDKVSHYSQHFKVIPVKAAFTGPYEGKEKPLNLGSYVQVEASKSLDGLGSFTVSAWVFPTFTPSDYKAPNLENPDPLSPPTINIAASIAALKFL